MLKILVPVDGSDNSNRAAAHVVKFYRGNPDIDVSLLNVQFPIESGHARLFVSPDQIDDYHREEGLAALAGAQRILDEGGVPCTHHIAVGRVAETIVRYANERGFDKIVMGTHGRTGLMEVLVGSVAREVLQHSQIPVTLVKPGAAEG